MQSSRMSPFRRPVSAAKKSVPGPSFGDWFDDCAGACSLVQIFSTTQSIPASRLNRTFLSEFSLVSFHCFRLWRHFATLSPILASRLCIQKFRFPRQGFRRPDPGGPLGIFGVWRPKTTFRTRSIIIADSIQGLRTVGSILPEHHEVARLQYRAANDLRPRRGRDLVRGTRARSSC